MCCPKTDRGTVCFKAEASETGTGKRDNVRLCSGQGWVTGASRSHSGCLIYKSNGSNYVV